MFCMVLANAYGGSLKAWLTYPARTEPIDTFEDILDSGLPWGMVLYGEQEEQILEESQDPIKKAIWEGKVVEEYSPTPKLGLVYRGEKILLDYVTGIIPNIFIRYSTRSGDPLVHLSPPLLKAKPMGKD